jgi:hypothetical protein
MEALLNLESLLKAYLPLAIVVTSMKSARELVLSRFCVRVGSLSCYCPRIVRDVPSNTVETRIVKTDASRVDFYIYPDLVTYATPAALGKIDGGNRIGKAYLAINYEGCRPLDLSEIRAAAQGDPMLPPKGSPSLVVEES